MTLSNASVSVFFTTVIEAGGINMKLQLKAVPGGVEISGKYNVQLQAGQENAPKMELLGPLYAWAKPRMKIAQPPAPPAPPPPAPTPTPDPDVEPEPTPAPVPDAGPAPTGRVCTPAAEWGCVCSNQTAGTKICNAQGDGFGKCVSDSTGAVCD
jgi:hypothetical protein